jgi:hypothetical protein
VRSTTGQAHGSGVLSRFLEKAHMQSGRMIRRGVWRGPPVAGAIGHGNSGINGKSHAAYCHHLCNGRVAGFTGCSALVHNTRVSVLVLALLLLQQCSVYVLRCGKDRVRTVVIRSKTIRLAD